MKKNIKIIFASVIVVGVTVITILSITASSAPNRELTTSEINIKYSELQDTTPKDVLVGDESSVDFIQQKVDKAEKALQADVKAYPILAKYSGKQYNRTELITDMQLDLDYMRAMSDLLRGDKLTDEERTILFEYVKRRYGWIYDQKELREEFEDVLNR